MYSFLLCNHQFSSKEKKNEAEKNKLFLVEFKKNKQYSKNL